MEHLRKILKEQFTGSGVPSNNNDILFSQMARKPSELGCLEFKYHDSQADIDDKVKEMTPLLNEIGVKFLSVIKLSNILVITANKTNAEEIKNICAKFDMTLVKETFSDQPKPYNALTTNTPPDMNNITDFGRGSSDGRSSFTAGSMMTGLPIDKLAGE